MDIGEPFLTQYRGKRTSFMVKEFVPGALAAHTLPLKWGRLTEPALPKIFSRQQSKMEWWLLCP
jgi:hypothetical protein